MFQVRTPSKNEEKTHWCGMTFHANFHSFQATWLQRRQADKKWPALAVASLASRSLTWEGRLDTTASKPNVQAEAMNVETTNLNLFSLFCILLSLLCHFLLLGPPCLEMLKGWESCEFSGVQKTGLNRFPFLRCILSTSWRWNMALTMKQFKSGLLWKNRMGHVFCSTS